MADFTLIRFLPSVNMDVSIQKGCAGERLLADITLQRSLILNVCKPMVVQFAYRMERTPAEFTLVR
jgi:hypothetical protein